ncbi:MAG: hypothetical protein V3V47_06775 [Desulfobacteria bacterium]
MEGIDETIAPLIEAMNKVPYLTTLSCCGGHPEESAVKEYGYAIATVVFDVEEEAENAIRWYGVVQDILSRRKAQQLWREHAFIFAKKFILNADGYLSWQWELKIQATGKTPEQCRAGLDEAIAFLTDYFRNMV